MSRVMVFRNSKCLRCSIIEEYMIRVGAFVMCNKCFPKCFSTMNPSVDERATYLKWLAKYNEEHS